MRNNATSVLMAAREVYPHLKARGGGLIVNIGSFYDKLGVPRSQHVRPATAYPRTASSDAIAAPMPRLAPFYARRSSEDSQPADAPGLRPCHAEQWKRTAHSMTLVAVTAS